MVKILVTGCGGDIGINIGKILKNFNIEAFGCDMNDIHVGNFFFKKTFKIPSVNNINYICEIKKIISNFKIDLIIPCTEIEQEYYQNNQFMKIILIDKKYYEIFSDKYKTSLFLKNNNLNYPITFELNNYDKSLDYPFILKSKKGCGNTSVFTINDKNTFNYYVNRIKDKNNYIVQEYLNGKEYTCCIFNSNNMYKKIIFERKLENGITKSGKVIINRNIGKLLDEIVKKTNLIGSFNIQLRLVNEIPYIFEINPRFSSTIYFRHLFNFNDLIWSINNILGENIETNNYDINTIKNKYFCHCNQHFILDK